MEKSTSTTYLKYRYASGFFTFINLIAIFVTVYLTFMHFNEAASGVCTFGEKWNCDIVNKSIYSEIFGIPVSILGLFTYAALFIAGIYLHRRGVEWFKKQMKLNLLNLLAFVGFAFSLYLTYVEAFILHAFCMFCVIQQVIIFLDLIIISTINISSKSNLKS